MPCAQTQNILLIVVIFQQNFLNNTESLPEVNEKCGELRKMSHPQGLETFLLWLMGRSMCGEVTLKVPRTPLLLQFRPPLRVLVPE